MPGIWLQQTRAQFHETGSKTRGRRHCCYLLFIFISGVAHTKNQPCHRYSFTCYLPE
ncbi:uncharacterized protein Asalp_27710 [Aeromonas salmonicida subsp. pectinolytica 34mel]|uniref:Uncharacterized protein n=1 Tax=Aeromonas salmonicida subsp. pectinolytica 34mel TaxID=1324960 RepID=A0A2D1QHJ5_AERSA|nr:uncharacterized protein Asalp_27710 [Aeromonas salmonicida subsp. pectinolytica 34mel]